MTQNFTSFYKNSKEIKEIANQKELPLIVLEGNLVIMPFLPIDINIPVAIADQLKKCLNDTHGYFILATKHNPLIADIRLTNLVKIVNICHINKLLPVDEFNYILKYTPEYKFTISELIKKDNPFETSCLGTVLDDVMNEEDGFLAEKTKLFSNFRKIVSAIGVQELQIIEEKYLHSNNELDPRFLIALVISYLNTGLTNQTKQLIQNELNVTRNMKILNKILEQSLSNSFQQEKNQLDKDITKKVQEKMTKQQHEYMINEKINELKSQLKDIKKGQKDSEDDENPIDEMKAKIDLLKVSDEVKSLVNKEFKRLKNLQPSSAEYNVVENWLSTMLSFPFNKLSKGKFDISKTRNILNEDHYGIDHVKKRVIQYLAVSHLNKKPNGQIICLYGPPGVGKTSVCKSIAKSLNREYIRISLGGMSDEAEIRGHRKTYVGAMPGKIIQELIKCKTVNPVIVLDEIDKISKVANKGSVEAAFLEVLDPEQNKTFVDHFMNVKIDLSQVIFIATANDLSQVSLPLLDRMELIEMDSYTALEKTQIATKYLIPQEQEKAGLGKIKVTIAPDCLNSLIEKYTREAGVRTLRKKIATLFRSCAEKFLDGQKEFSITNENLLEFIDDDFYEREKRKTAMVAGMATGLAWTPVGGAILFIEASKMAGSGQIKLTGQLGDVMKESAQIALSYIKEHAESLHLSVSKDEDIHIHFPAGATPKDGPSAGIALVTTLVSLLQNKPMKPTVAMTGEISLKGEVLPVGGIKEKLIAAYSAGIEEVIIPKENEKDIKKLPEELRNSTKFKIYPVSTIDDVLKIAF